MEIERKWLVKPEKIPYELDTLQCLEIEQGYVCVNPTIRFRRINDSEYVLTVKTGYGISVSGLERNETEIPLTESEYNHLKELMKGTTVCKKRYIHSLGNGLKEEIDIFEGALEGLAFMEIEFPDTETARAWPDPVWVERDVTSDRRYTNAALAMNGKPEEQK